MASRLKHIRFLDEIGIDDVPSVGGKNASLGEMYRQLTLQGVKIPNGVAISACAYRHVLDQAGAWGALRRALDNLDPKTSPTWAAGPSGLQDRRISVTHKIS